MYNREMLKKMLRKANKKINSLKSAIAICNKVVYTEQNEQEIKSAKSFIEYKLVLLEDMATLIKDYFNSNNEYSEDRFFESLESLKKLYNKLCTDAYLTHLQEVYGQMVETETLAV